MYRNPDGHGIDARITGLSVIRCDSRGRVEKPPRTRRFQETGANVSARLARAPPVKDARRNECCQDDQTERVGDDTQDEGQQAREQQSQQYYKDQVHAPVTSFTAVDGATVTRGGA